MHNQAQRHRKGTTNGVATSPYRLPASLFLASLLLLLSNAPIAQADDGYRLWLRYDPLPSPVIRNYRTRLAAIVVPGESATLVAVRAELATGLSTLR